MFAVTYGKDQGFSKWIWIIYDICLMFELNLPHKNWLYYFLFSLSLPPFLTFLPFFFLEYLLIYFQFFKIHFYWSIVASQCCFSFYCTTKWIRDTHACTHACTHAHTHAHTCTHTRAHTHTHTLYFQYFLINFHWCIVASQYCVSFYCIAKLIRHTHTCIPSFFKKD